MAHIGRVARRNVAARRPSRGQRGMVTAELAVSLLTAALVAALACWGVSLVITKTRCGDVAGQVARQLARGDRAAAAAAERRAPDGARVDIHRSASAVTVVVQVDSSWGVWGPVHLTGRATADVEPGVG